MFLQTTLCFLLAVQLADIRPVSGFPTPADKKPATLLANGIHPETLCCKRTEKLEPLKLITTLEACAAHCKKLKLRPIQLGKARFACDRAKYSCDQVGQGGIQCGACYKAGTCYLIPFVGGIRSSKKTEITKKTKAEEEQREKVFRELGQGVRETGLGGIASIQSTKSGKSQEAEANRAKILTKRVTTSLATENFAGFPKGSALGPKDFLGGGAGIGKGFAGRIGPNGAIRKTEEIELAQRQRVLNSKKQLASKRKENFAQDLSALGPGQRGSFASSGSTSELLKEQGKRVEAEKSQTKTNKLKLSGTASRSFGGGPVELTQQNKKTAGTESELKRGTRVVGERFGENLVRKLGPKLVEVASIRGRRTERIDTQKKVKGRSLGSQNIRQVATNRGINQELRGSRVGQRQTNTATQRRGKFATVEKSGQKCQHCTSTLTTKTKGQTYGGSREKLQEQTRSNVRRSLRGRAGKGATIATSGREVNKFRRQKVSGGGSKISQSYRGANTLLSNTGLTKGRVQGSTATRTRRRSLETEEGVSVEDTKAFSVAGFPTKVHDHDQG